RQLRADRLEQLRANFERLRADGPRRRLLRPGATPSLEPLETLDARLTQAGVHTAADLRLLLRLARRDGSQAELARRFGERADAALAALRARLAWNRRTADGRWAAGERARLERAFLRAERVVRTADLLEGRAEVLPDWPLQPPPFTPRRRWTRPRTAVASFLLERGLGEVADPERRRLDVQRAHALLEAGALDEDATELRLRAARDRSWDDAVPGDLRGWPRQAEWALARARAEPREAYAALRIQYLRAVESGRAEAALALRAALDAFRFDLPVSGSVSPRPEPGEAAGEDRLVDLLFETGRQERPLLDLGRAAARLVAWDDAPIAGERVATADARQIAPDRRLELAVTSSVAEVRDFVVEDPRRLVHDLASGAQRVRRLVGGTSPRPARRVRARVYLADASGSMRGGRARLRDGLLLAELDGLRRVALRGAPVDPLDLCFFGDRTLAFERIETAEAARAWIGRLVGGGPSAGMTELSAALAGAAQWLHDARRDPALASALVVVVTDGEDAIDLQRIDAAWATIRGLPVSLRVVCLGDENPWLKGWVARQRASGRDAGWLHLDDASLAGMPVDFDFRPATLLPRPERVQGVDLEQLRPHLEALARVAAGEEPASPPVDAPRFDAMFPEPGQTDGADDPWTVDALEAIAEAASLAPFEQRASEAVLLLEHLLGQREVPVAAHLTRHVRPGPSTADALRRLRLLCRPVR
ncbi:MAG TPA: vWA domain-containing protein, partial [Myxococcaceae bacterium]|nr:vWA domain-containing protein [Myxococcaceae bacterium]